MNVNDTEVVWAILKENDYEKTNDLLDADVVLIGKVLYSSRNSILDIISIGL